MAIKWWERPTSRETPEESGKTLHYGLSGTDNDVLAYSLALGYSPALYAGLYRTGLSLTPGGHLLWYVEVEYGPKQKKKPEAGDFSWNFTTGGATKHITQSLSTTGRYVPDGKTAANHKGAIGINENGDVEGCDVPDQGFKWTENWKLLLANYGFTYSATVAALKGTVNDATFRGFPAKTVLLEDIDGGQSLKAPEILDITFHFAYSKPDTNLPIGDITVASKPGWDYLWVEHQATEDASAKRLARPPIQVNVEKVIEESDFSLLGIGTDPL